MPISFVGKTTGAGMGVTALTLNKPAGVAAGDELTAFVLVFTSGAVMTGPAAPYDWELVTSVLLSSGARLYAYRRTAGASEPASYTWTSDRIMAWCGELSARRGLPATRVYDYATSTNASATNHSTGTVDVLAESTVVAAFAGVNNALAFTSTSGMTARSDVTGMGGRLGTFDQEIAVAGTDQEAASTTSAENSATILLTLGGNAAPVASATLTLDGRTLTLEDTSTDDVGVEAVTVDWGDGTAPEAITPGATVTHTYPYATTTYTVQVTATDGGGLQGVWSDDVSVVDVFGAIAASGAPSYDYRLLSVDPTWPDTGAPQDDPPFGAPGMRVTVPAIPDPVPVYDPATFDPSVWTDVSALVVGYPSYSQRMDLACDRLSIQVAAGWAETDVRAVVREMRVLLLQERWRGAGQDTGWFNVAWCLSDGFDESWDRAQHGLRVTGRDACKLLSLHLMGRESGSEVYQPDLVQAGTVASHQTLVLVREAADAWEFGLPSRVTGNAHPNWAPQPAPQLWCHNVPSSAQPVRLEVAGDAVQVVFGEGVVRVSKGYAAASPGPSGKEDYSVGLGITGQPDIRGVVYRYAHPATEGADGPVDTDLIPSMVVAASGAGYIDVAGDYSAWPSGLTLYALDGTGDEWHVRSLSYSAPNTRFALVEAGAVIAPGRTLAYGRANAVTDVLRRWALRCGCQVDDANAVLHFEATDPVVLGAAEPIALPPLTYEDTEQRTPLAALEDLRREGYVPPNYLPRADAQGRVTVASIEQLAPGHPDILPLDVLMVPASIRRTDRQVYTDVVARGLVRQVTNAAAQTGVTVTTVGGADGLPAPAYALYGQQVPDAGRLAALLKPEGSAPGGAGVSAVLRRLFGWALHPYDNPTDAVKRDALWAQWCGAGMVDITLASEVEVHGIDLDISNPWVFAWQQGSPRVISENAGWYDGDNIYGLPEAKHTYRPARLDLQALAIQYLDPETGAWRPLATGARGRYQFPDVLRLTADQFDTKAPVMTERLRIICLEPAVTMVGTYSEDPNWYYAQWSFYLSAVRVWSSSEIRAVARLGQTAPFDTAAWQTVRKRLRPRCWVMPGAVPWASTQAKADELAGLWLREFARDLAPRQLVAYRPDVRVGMTVRATLPGGNTQDYLVIGTERSRPGVVAVTAVDYGSPYEEW